MQSRARNMVCSEFVLLSSDSWSKPKSYTAEAELSTHFARKSLKVCLPQQNTPIFFFFTTLAKKNISESSEIVGGVTTVNTFSWEALLSHSETATAEIWIFGGASRTFSSGRFRWRVSAPKLSLSFWFFTHHPEHEEAQRSWPLESGDSHGRFPFWTSGWRDVDLCQNHSTETP